MAQMAGVTILAFSAVLPVWLARGILEIIVASLASPRRAARRT